MRVLIVEDDAVLADGLVRSLRRAAIRSMRRGRQAADAGSRPGSSTS